MQIIDDNTEIALMTYIAFIENVNHRPLTTEHYETVLKFFNKIMHNRIKVNHAVIQYLTGEKV